MKKYTLIAAILLLNISACTKNKDNQSAVTRTFTGTAYGDIDAQVITTEHQTDQSAEVKVTYTDDDGTMYLDTVKMVFTGGIQLKPLDNRSRGSVNTLSFSGLPKGRAYKCLITRTFPNVARPDTMISISCN